MKQEVELLQEELEENLKARQVCQRELPNRHGHSSKFEKSLLIDTNEEYCEARMGEDGKDVNWRKETDESGVVTYCAAGGGNSYLDIVKAKLDFAQFFGKALLAAKSDALLMRKSDPEAKNFNRNLDEKTHRKDDSFLFVDSHLADTEHDLKTEDIVKAVNNFLNYAAPGKSSGREYLDKVIVNLVRKTEEPSMGEITLKRKISAMRDFIAVCQVTHGLAVAKTFRLVEYVHFDKNTAEVGKNIRNILQRIKQKRWRW